MSLLRTENDRDLDRLRREPMRIIQLKCESDQSPYDQTVREVAIEREDDSNWYGKPTENPACTTLQWPKFAWKEVEQQEGQESARTLA